MGQDPLHLLCVEPRFPGRLGPVADWLVRKRGYRCQFYYNTAEPPERWPAAVGRGLELVHFNVGGVAREPAVPWTRLLERGLCYAYGCCEVMQNRRARGFDLALGRSHGLGSTLFVPIFQQGVPIVNYFDYFYHAHAHDLAEEASPDTPPEYFHWRRSANAMDALDLETANLAWTATSWQRDLYPPEYRDDFLVLHDGVDTQALVRAQQARRIAGRVIPSEMRVVTFVAQNLDRLRGFDRFVELANKLLRARSDVLCVVLGGPTVQRGLDIHFYKQEYRAHVFAKHPPHDPERFWLLGTAAPSVVAEALAASDLHVYPSRSFPIARSLLEAMAVGCVVLAWDSEPVREVVTNGVNGLLVPPGGAAEAEGIALQILADRAGYQPLGAAAAALVRERYAQEVTLPRLAEALCRIVEGKR